MAIAGFYQFLEGTTPSTPSTGNWLAYFKSDGLYVLDDAGTETKIVSPTTLDLTSLTTDQLFLDDGSELTMDASGAITITTARHTVDTYSDAASDDLDTISGMVAGELCIITANNSARTVVVKHGTDNITCANARDISLDDTVKTVLLLGTAAGVNAYPLFERNTQVDTTDVSNPPTDAEIDSIFGTPATVGAGFTAYIDDAGAGSNFYQVTSDGTNWWIFTGTKAV